MLFALTVVTSPSLAQQDEFDQYKVRISAFWFRSDPSGNLHGSGSTDSGIVDISRDLGFSTFDTFAGKFDWRFARKHHLTVVSGPLNRSNRRVLDRTITFQGQTFDASVSTTSNLDANLYAVGYQYDVTRRRRGHLGIAVQLNVFDTDARITAAATTGPGGATASRTASGSFLAAIPVAGPEFRVYLTNSPRLFLEGNVYGMYLFGYGNFISSSGDLGLTLSKHLSVNAGYQLGSRLVVKNNSSNRIGLRLTQMGTLVGLQFSF